MRKFASIPPRIWQADLKSVRGDLDAIAVHYHLTTSGHANMLGLYYVPVAYMAHEIGCPIEGASKGLSSLIQAGICAYDYERDLVWVCEMASDQIAPQLSPKDKRVRGIAEQLSMLPICLTTLGFYGKYRLAFHLHEERCLEEFELAYSELHEAPSKPLGSKEKEKDKKKDLEEGKGTFGFRTEKTSKSTLEEDSMFKPYPIPESPSEGRDFLSRLNVPQSKMDECLRSLLGGNLTPFDLEDIIGMVAKGAA
ncbi:hypothetical protein QA646_17785 [Rhizobium sp. CB3090]|uniref:hypothetical protein n=1 Tax=Rhizobium sp. CB3090 TaxID=3039156 RepID=UPI0024B28248|nr:hypothetical protein [Rhizobium sp. CB3090]WFU09097.1 hypothetical protein QA646_17785 [Rhizobium sp. CB3090]